MTFRIAAPFPNLVTNIVLPNPQFGDSEATTGELNIIRSVNGKRRTYVKSKGGRRKLNWSFRLTRNKSLELLEFMRSYHGDTIFIEDHNGRLWQGNIVTNPFEMSGASRGAPELQDWPVGETWTSEFEFEGFRIDSEPRGPLVFPRSAITDLRFTDGVGVERELPNFGFLVHNWDADTIAGSIDGQRLYTWPDIGPAANDLIATVGGISEPALDRSPTFKANSINFRGGVSFELVSGNISQDIAAMETGGSTTIFPFKRGTIFWVMQHTILTNTLAGSAEEYSVWSQGDDGSNDIVEQFHLTGGSNASMPATARFLPANTANDIRLHKTASNVVPGFSPFIMVLQRNTNTTLRWRFNGIEKDGATITDNTPVGGTFRVNNHQYIPSSNIKITGIWGQILVYNKELDTTQIDSVEAFLSEKWGITLGVDF